MRFHSVLISLQNSIPVIVINYSDKVCRLMCEYNLDMYCLNPYKVSLSKLLNMIHEIKKIESSLLKRLKKVIICKIKD